MRRWAHWTTAELRHLAMMHAKRRPTVAELVAAFPRHPCGSIKSRAIELNLRRNDVRWLLIVHRHFARREQGRLV